MEEGILISRKDLRLIIEALVWADEFFAARDVMNSKVYCAPVTFSPITERVQAAYILASDILDDNNLGVK